MTSSCACGRAGMLLPAACCRCHCVHVFVHPCHVRRAAASISLTCPPSARRSSSRTRSACTTPASRHPPRRCALYAAALLARVCLCVYVCFMCLLYVCVCACVCACVCVCVCVCVSPVIVAAARRSRWCRRRMTRRWWWVHRWRSPLPRARSPRPRHLALRPPRAHTGRRFGPVRGRACGGHSPRSWRVGLTCLPPPPPRAADDVTGAHAAISCAYALALAVS